MVVMSYFTRIDHVAMYYMIAPRVSAEISPGVNWSRLGSPIVRNGTAESVVEPAVGLQDYCHKSHCNEGTEPVLRAAPN